MSKKVINRVYPNAEEKLVKSTILYVNASDNNLYFDQAYEHAATKEEALNLFLQGLVVVIEGKYYRPVCFEIGEETATVTVVGEDGEAAAYNTTAVEAE